MANIYILSLVSLVLAFISTCQVIHLSSSSCGPCIAVDTVVALPRSAFQTSYSFLHLLGVLAAEGSQLSPSLGNEIQKGAALPKVILPSLEEWRENLYPMTDGFRAHRFWALALIWDYSKGSYIPAVSIEPAEPSATTAEHVNSSLGPINLLPSFRTGVRCLTWNTTHSWFPREPDLKFTCKIPSCLQLWVIFLKPPNIYCSLSLSYPVGSIQLRCPQIKLSLPYPLNISLLHIFNSINIHPVV